MSKKYLFLLDSLPPCKSANGICVSKILTQFPNISDVWAVTVEDGSPCNKLGVSEKRIPQSPWNKIAEFCRRKGKNSFYSLLLRPLLLIKRLIMLPVWPVTSFSACYNFYKEASHLVKTRGITHVVAVCVPGETLISMIFLKIRFRNKIKTIMYPLDVTLGGKFSGFSFENRLSAFFSSFFYRLCARFADKIIVLENTIALYKDKLSTQSQKFEICGLPLIENEISVAKKIDENNIHLLYGGNIIKSIRNPDFLFRFLNECSQKNLGNVTVHIYGFVSEPLLKDFVSKYNSVVFLYHGWVSEDVLSQAIIDADALISIGNNVGHFIPSKLFKYMSLKKPIIHFSFIENDPCVPYLKKYEHSYIIRNNEKTDAREFSDWLMTRPEKIDVDLEKLFYRCLPRYTAEKIQF